MSRNSTSSKSYSPEADFPAVLRRFGPPDSNIPEILEMGGAQLLLFLGFFRDQVERQIRKSWGGKIDWYDQMGQAYYDRAAYYQEEGRKRRVFEKMSVSFPLWALTCRNLSRQSRFNRYLLTMRIN